MTRKNCFILLSAIIALSACTQKKQAEEPFVEETLVATLDTAYYGKCGDATTMHNLQLITDDGKEMEFIIDEDSSSMVVGGLLAGDRFSVTFNKTADGNVVSRALNITTLLGHWTSLDRNFEILEDGTIRSNVTAESKPYNAWTVINANLVLNQDTFTVVSLGADSLALENADGIFVYKRQR